MDPQTNTSSSGTAQSCWINYPIWPTQPHSNWYINYPITDFNQVKEVLELREKVLKLELKVLELQRQLQWPRRRR